MKKEIFITQTQKETWVAIKENGQLAELYVEKPDSVRMVGNIYKGIVENVLEGMQAAFVDIGYESNAFLPFSEISEGLSSLEQAGAEEAEEEDEEESAPPRRRTRRERKRHPIEHPNLKTGQEILVQVIKEPYLGKGARVTTDISLPGRFLVLVPNADYIGVSRKIYNNYERRRLRRLCADIQPKGFGLIARTVAEGKDREVLEADLNNLLDGYERMQEAIRKKSAPALVYKDMETVSSLVRDLFTQDVSSVVVDSKKLFNQLQGYLRGAAPQLVDRLELYKQRLPLFTAFNIEKEIERSLDRKVPLKSGAQIVIEQTEALVAIDVNSGRYVGRRDHEANALKINLEAAREIARQLRLRDLGGLIVIDFIDMMKPENKKKVYYELRRELRKDRAKVAVNTISDFGLLEMTRQRVRLSLLLSATEVCPVCKGRGRIPSKSSMATKIESWFKRFRARRREFRVELRVHPELANFLTSGRKNFIRSLQWQHLMKIDLIEDESLNIDEFRVFSRKQKKDITDEY